MKYLQVAPDHKLPAEMLTDSTTILGRKRSGKSNNAVVIVEETLDLKGQVIIIDPKGDWWGMTSSEDGKSEGYPIVVLGGKHGQLPLNTWAGAAIADWVIDTGHSVILDLQGLDVADIERFCSAFLWQLRRRQEAKPKPILLVIDEADELAPEDQRERINVIKTLRIVIWMVKRGGFVGIGTLVITQRPASLNKNVLSQTEVLIVLQVTSAQDLDAITDGLRHHVEGKDKKERAVTLENLLRDIVKLPKGEAIIVSGQLLKGIFRIPFRRRRTFDSGATPKFGAAPRIPKVTAKVALVQLSEAMEKAVAEAKANDPAVIRRELIEARARILELERRPPVAPPKRVDVPVLKDAQITRLEKLVERGHKIADRLVGHNTDLLGQLAALTLTVQKFVVASSGASSVVAPHPSPLDGQRSEGASVRAGVRVAANATGSAGERAQEVPRVGTITGTGAAGRRGTDRSAPTPTQPARTINDDGTLSKAEHRMLVTAGELTAAGIPATRTALGAWQGLRADTGRFGSYIARLLALGLITQNGDAYAITREGEGRTGPLYAPTAQELHDRIRARLDGRERDVFDAVMQSGDISRDELGAQMGLRGDTGRFGSYLARLRDMGAIEYERGSIRIGEHLRAAVAA